MIRRALFLLSLVFALSGCDNSIRKDVVYCFVGDSLIARWPVSESFPSQLVYNYGKSGARIDYIKDMNGRFNNQDVVVMIGTNDYASFAPDGVGNYVDDYLLAVSRLTDKSIYLFSHLPREFAGDPSDVNTVLSEVNSLIRSRAARYSNIVYIDVFDDFMYGGHINYQYYSDGLHLNTYGYEVLSTHLLKFIYDAE